ncbi:MAG: M24 family metallopeptidase [Oscillospiraceae bacterium]|jgi:Xaa-Pro aminopeptidase|nr:M24 family metallopeptidase [Oscillospiraceae bacterium]
MVTIETGVRYQGRPSKEEMARRHALAVAFMKERGLDYLVMQANEGVMCEKVRWFCEIRSVHYTYVLFDKEGALSMISHGAEGGKALGWDVGLTNNIAVPVFNNAAYGDSFAADKAVGIMKKTGCEKIGFLNLNLITTGFYLGLLKGLPGAEALDVTDEFDYLVAVKSDEELRMLEEACVMHDRAAEAIPALLYAGRLEREFGADLYRLAVLMAADEYLPNIAVGSSKMQGPMYNLHFQNKIIEAGDVLNILFEVPTITGYYSDLHRYYSMGSPAPEMLEVHEGAEKLQDYIASLCKPGVKSCDIFAESNRWLKDNGFAPEVRLCGHGQGYGLVERPYFDAYDQMILKENMYLAIHATVGKGNASVCPSDNYVVTKEGAKRMTGYRRGLIRV